MFEILSVAGDMIFHPVHASNPCDHPSVHVSQTLLT